MKAGAVLDNVEEATAELYAKVQAMVGGSEHVDMEFHTMGFRPTPADGFPMIGRPKNMPGLYLASMHSGVTLAPVVGLFASHELLDDRRDQLLLPYHPDRLLKSIV